MNLEEMDRAISSCLRLETFPVAVRLCQTSTELPEKVRIPKRDFGIKIALCQAINMARRYGWAIAVGKEDQSCPFGSIILGFLPADQSFLKAEIHESTTAGNREATARTAQSMRRLEHNKYKYLVAAPLQTTTFEPHVVLIYGNSAQVTRLVQSRLHGQGGALNFSALGDAVCNDTIAGPMLTDECQIGLPCMGDRIFGLTLDHELIFAIPWSKAERVISGLEATHKAGQRMPIPYFLRFEPQWPPSYKKLMDHLSQTERTQ